MSGDDGYEQARFSGGEVVRAPRNDSMEGGAPCPNEETGYALAIKPGALEVNEPLVDVQEEHGDVVTFESRGRAEAFANALSARDGDLRVQAAAPNDPADVDGYLLAEHSPSVTEPASVAGDTLTFDVGANLYGALGEAVLLGGPHSPALKHFVEQDLTDVEFRDGLRLHVVRGEFVSFDGEQRSRWHPDCRIEARDGWRDPPVEEYWCEIKTGEASFERTQVAAMRELAKEARVLKIRVRIDDLPNEYSVRIREVDPIEE